MIVITGGRGSQRRFLFLQVFDLQSTIGVEGDVFHLMIELVGDQGRGVGIEHLIDSRHHPHAHQFFNDVAGFNAHFPRQIPHSNDF